MSVNQKELKKQAKVKFQNPYKVGDILHHSWGYDQTNCDFYQVVEVKKASVVLKPIAAETVPGLEGFMCESLMPRKDVFLTDHTQALTKNDRRITSENPSIEKRVYFLCESRTARSSISSGRCTAGATCGTVSPSIPAITLSN